MNIPAIDPLYAIRPKCFERGVPVFIERRNASYVENYDRISSDHIESIERCAGNPFIEETVWGQIERNTIAHGKRWFRPGMVLLDVGVGTGRLLAQFTEARRYGIDVSINYAERLTSSGSEIAVGSVEELPYVDQAFDLVFCTDVLEHVENLLLASRELVRVLKPGGVLVVRVPYREDLSPYLESDYPYRFAHLRAFDEFSLRLLFERQLELSVEQLDFDYAAIPSCIRLPLPRGKRALTQAAFAWANRFSSVQGIVHRIFRPLEVTMSFRRPGRAA